MTRDHALIEELLAIRALDGLDEDDAARLERELAVHGDCDECRRLQAEHAEVAGMLALALDPRPVDPRMADRILAEPQRSGGATAGAVDEVSARRDRRLGSLAGRVRRRGGGRAHPRDRPGDASGQRPRPRDDRAIRGSPRGAGDGVHAR